MGIIVHVSDFENIGIIDFYVLRRAKEHGEMVSKINSGRDKTALCSLRSKAIISKIRKIDKKKSEVENAELKKVINRKIAVMTLSELSEIIQNFKKSFSKSVVNAKRLNLKETHFISLNSVDKKFEPIIKIFRKDRNGNCTTPKIYEKAKNCIFLNPERKKSNRKRAQKVGYCEICNVSFVKIETHLKSSGHLKQLTKSKFYEKLDNVLNKF
ncbi:hypothetical protein MHBO_002674 [Bonamia ostreae]|uniref:DBF4-type domain-containing protein n=1 Tax=Bonamia ostreae TaxID=126728 RepID=A0ABV2AN59_9EUKA